MDSRYRIDFHSNAIWRNGRIARNFDVAHPISVIMRLFVYDNFHLYRRESRMRARFIKKLTELLVASKSKRRLSPFN